CPSRARTPRGTRARSRAPAAPSRRHLRPDEDDRHVDGVHAAAAHLVHVAEEVPEAHAVAPARDPPEQRRDHAADRLELLRHDLVAEALVPVAHGEAARDAVATFAERHDGFAAALALDAQLAHDLLEDVLDRDDAGGAAPLVD